MAGRILTRDLDARINSIEEKLAEVLEKLAHLDQRIHYAARQVEEAADPAHQAHNGGGAAHSNGSESGRLEELESQVAGLSDRVEKITHTLVTQASRFA